MIYKWNEAVAVAATELAVARATVYLPANWTSDLNKEFELNSKIYSRYSTMFF